VPFPKKPSSPTSRVLSLRIPADEFDTFKEVLAAAEDHADVSDQPFAAYKTLSLSLALLLQDPLPELR